MKMFQHRITTVLLAALVLAGASGCSKHARAVRQLNSAHADFAAEHYDNAEVEYKKAWQLEPDSTVPIGQLGLIYFNEGRMIDARKFLGEAVRRLTNNMEYTLKYGQAISALGDKTNSAKFALRVLNVQPANGDALFLLADGIDSPQLLSQKMQSVPHIDQNPAYRAVVGMVELREQKYEQGEKDLLAAAAAGSAPQPYLVLAELYAFQKKEKEGTAALQKASELSPLRSPIRIKYSEFLLRTGQMDAGRKLLEDMTDKAPDYLPGWIARMNLAMAERKYDDAAKYSDIIIGRDPYSYEGWLARGRISMGKGDAQAAVTHLEHMASIYKQNPPCRYELALAYLMSHDNAKAIQNLQQAIEMDPMYLQAVIVLGELDIKLGDPASAVEPLTKFLKKDPNSPRAQLLLADAYIGEQRPESAMAIYRNLAQQNPKNGQIQMLMGIAMAAERRNADARAYFEKSLELAPDFIQALQQLVNLDINEKKFSDASTLIQVRVQKDPKLPDLWELQAKVDIAQNNLTKAEADLQKAVELNPNLSNAYVLLAQVYASNGKDQEALKELNTLVDRTNSTIAYEQIGYIHQRLKQYDEAAKAYEKALVADPDSSVVLNDLAYLDAVYLNKVEKGLELAQKARSLAPNNPNVADTMGWILVKKGDYATAIPLLEDCAAKSPNDPEIQFHLGTARYMFDDEDAARAALQRAVASTQDYPNKEDARRELAVLNTSIANATPATLADMEKASQEHPEDPVLLTRVGELQESAGALEKAAASFEAAHKQNPESVRVMLRLAQLYAYKMNASEKALPLATAAHKLAPENAQVSAVLGHAVFRSGDFDYSFSLLENAAARVGNDSQILSDLAWAYYSRGRVADAQASMQKAVQAGGAFTGGADAKQFLDLTAALDNPAAAQAASAQAGKALQADSHYVPALMIIGANAEAAGDFKTAQDNYSKALDVYPRFAPALRRLTMLDAAHFRDDSKALAWGDKARSAYPGDVDVSESLGILNYYQGKYSRAVELLQDCASKGKSDGELYYCLGMSYAKISKRREAKQALEKAVSMNIPDKEATDARQTLTTLK